ncbi:MAG: hypothetical protein V3T72_03610, partial [Thermoanaerobaculia bacterium]
MHRIPRHQILSATLILLLSAGVAYAGEAEAVDAAAALDMIRSLAGEWTVAVPEEAEGEHGDTAQHIFRRSANDSVVMETMWEGTDHEMINMYHLDGEDLVLTHYCAAGNQPHMKLDRAASTSKKLHFAFAGGTNLDPEKDMHIHAASVTFVDDG